MRVSSLSVNHGNDVMMAQFSFLSSSQTRDFQAPSQEMGVKNCQCIVKKNRRKFPTVSILLSTIEMTSKSS